MKITDERISKYISRKYCGECVKWTEIEGGSGTERKHSASSPCYVIPPPPAQLVTCIPAIIQFYSLSVLLALMDRRYAL